MSGVSVYSQSQHQNPWLWNHSPLSFNIISLRTPRKHHTLHKTKVKSGCSEIRESYLLPLDLQEENEAAQVPGQLCVSMTWPALWIPESLLPQQGEPHRGSVPGSF